MLIIQAKRKITELLKFPLGGGGGGGGGVAKTPCFNHSYVRNNHLNTQYLFFYFHYEQFIGMTPQTTNLEFGLSNSQAFSNIN